VPAVVTVSPTPVSGKPNTAFSAAIRISQLMANSHPPPRAYLGLPRSEVCPASISTAGYLQPVRLFNPGVKALPADVSFKSSPAQKDLPVPVKITDTVFCLPWPRSAA